MYSKCLICGKVVKVLNGEGNVICCGKEMLELKPNSTDAAFEKHVPECEIKDNKVYIKVNHVMESDHFIEWVSIENNNEFHMKKFKPGEVAEAVFDYIPNAVVHSYCNKHNLWENKIN